MGSIFPHRKIAGHVEPKTVFEPLAYWYAGRIGTSEITCFFQHEKTGRNIHILCMHFKEFTSSPGSSCRRRLGRRRLRGHGGPSQRWFDIPPLCLSSGVGTAVIVPLLSLKRNARQKCTKNDRRSVTFCGDGNAEMALVSSGSGRKPEHSTMNPPNLTEGTANWIFVTFNEIRLSAVRQKVSLTRLRCST